MDKPLRKGRQTQQATILYDSTVTKYQRQVNLQRKQINGYQGLRGKREWRVTTNGYGVTSRV